MLRWLALITLLLQIPLAFADPEITPEDKPLVVSREKGEFTIRLPSNPTTGFSWFLLSYDYQLLKVTSHQLVVPEKKLVGAGGYEEWKFTLTDVAKVAPTITEVEIIYARPGEAKAGDDQEFTVVIH